MDVDRIWDLTPHQLGRYFDGANRARRYEREMTAWQLAHQLSIWSKKPITMAKLLGRRGSVSAADYATVGEFQAAVAQRKLEDQ